MERQNADSNRALKDMGRCNQWIAYLPLGPQNLLRFLSANLYVILIPQTQRTHGEAVVYRGFTSNSYILFHVGSRLILKQTIVAQQPGHVNRTDES